MPAREQPGQPEPAPIPAPGRNEWLLAAGVVIAGLALRVWVLRQTSGLTMDSPLYVRMSWLLGKELVVLGPAHHGYSALIKLASLVLPGNELPGRMISLLAGVLLIVVTWRLTRRFLPAPGAATAAALVAFHPLMALSSVTLMTEATFQVLVYTALLVLLSGRVALGGVTLGLAYCVRPEAAGIAVAAIPAVRSRRSRLIWIAAFVLAALPEVLMLSAERGTFALTAKPGLVALAGAPRDDAEWRVADQDSTVRGHRGPWTQRVREDVSRAAGRYPDRMVRWVRLVHQMWPAPLMALSVVGAIVQPGVLLAPLAILPVLPLVGVTPNLRYPQTVAPALAIFAAIGAAWIIRRASRPRLRAVMAGTLGVVMVLGLVWCWRGRAGVKTWAEDGPMFAYRSAGAWLAAHGRPGAMVMDRKVYVPFFAGMLRAAMPDDDYETLVTYAIRSGVDYIVIEEYLMWSIRRQFVPLMTDPEVRAREQRLRMIYFAQEAPRAGVAIFEVVQAR